MARLIPFTVRSVDAEEEGARHSKQISKLPFNYQHFKKGHRRTSIKTKITQEVQGVSKKLICRHAVTDSMSDQ